MKKRVSVALLTLLCVSGLAAIIITKTSYYKGGATAIEGLNCNITAVKSENLSDVIIARHAAGRTLELRLKNEEADAFKVVKKLKLNDEDEQQVRLCYPDYWKNANKTIWKVVLRGDDNSCDYSSREIHIMTSNREELALKCKGAVVMDCESKQIYYQKNMTKKLQNASTTKIMTALLAIENKNLDSVVNFSKTSMKTPYTFIAYGAGEKAYMEDVLYDALLTSSNGAAKALAEHIAGTEKEFCNMMNERAERMGCENTNFKNSHGLDEKGHYTTAKDLALITTEAMKNKTFAKIAGAKKHKIRTLKSKTQYNIASSNELLRMVKCATGVKPGYDEKSKYCLVGSFYCNGHSYVTVVLGDPCYAYRLKDTKKLIKYIRKYV